MASCDEEVVVDDGPLGVLPTNNVEHLDDTGNCEGKRDWRTREQSDAADAERDESADCEVICLGELDHSCDSSTWGSVRKAQGEDGDQIDLTKAESLESQIVVIGNGKPSEASSDSAREEVVDSDEEAVVIGGSSEPGHDSSSSSALRSVAMNPEGHASSFFLAKKPAAHRRHSDSGQDGVVVLDPSLQSPRIRGSEPFCIEEGSDGEERVAIQYSSSGARRSSARGASKTKNGSRKPANGADDVHDIGEMIAGPGDEASNALADRLRVSSTVGRTFQCPVCMDDVEKGGQVCIFGCGHRLCFTCAGTFVATKVRDGQVSREALKCALPDCATPLAPHEVRGCIAEDGELLKRYERFGLQRFLENSGDSIFYCPGKGCEYVVDAGPARERAEEFSCPLCKSSFCLRCKEKWHPKVSCEVNAATLEAKGEDKGFLRYVQRKKMKKCPKCRMWVEKSEGCNAMTCRCGTTFCWRCGVDVNNEKGCACLANLSSLSARDRADVLQVNAHSTNQENPAHQQLAHRLAAQHGGMFGMGGGFGWMGGGFGMGEGFGMPGDFGGGEGNGRNRQGLVEHVQNMRNMILMAAQGLPFGGIGRVLGRGAEQHPAREAADVPAADVDAPFARGGRRAREGWRRVGADRNEFGERELGRRADRNELGRRRHREDDEGEWRRRDGGAAHDADRGWAREERLSGSANTDPRDSTRLWVPRQVAARERSRERRSGRGRGDEEQRRDSGGPRERSWSRDRGSDRDGDRERTGREWFQGRRAEDREGRARACRRSDSPMSPRRSRGGPGSGSWGVEWGGGASSAAPGRSRGGDSAGSSSRGRGSRDRDGGWAGGGRQGDWSPISPRSARGGTGAKPPRGGRAPSPL